MSCIFSEHFFIRTPLVGCLWKNILYDETNYYFEASPTKIQRETLKIAGRSTNFQSMFTKNLYAVKLKSCMVLTLLKNNLFIHLFLPIPDKNTLGLWISKLLQQMSFTYKDQPFKQLVFTYIYLKFRSSWYFYSQL